MSLIHDAERFTKKPFMKRLSGKLCAALVAVGAAAFSGCIGPQEQVEQTALGAPGTLAMALVSTDADGNRLRLRGCDLEVSNGTGAVHLALDLDRTGLDDTEIAVDLPADTYTVRLVEDSDDRRCALERLGTDGYESVDFRQLAPLAPEAQVRAGARSGVVFRFEVRSEPVAFAPGQLEVRVETEQVACLPEDEASISCSVDGQLGAQRLICVDGEMRVDSAAGCELSDDHDDADDDSAGEPGDDEADGPGDEADACEEGEVEVRECAPNPSVCIRSGVPFVLCLTAGGEQELECIDGQLQALGHCHSIHSQS